MGKISLCLNNLDSYSTHAMLKGSPNQIIVPFAWYRVEIQGRVSGTLQNKRHHSMTYLWPYILDMLTEVNDKRRQLKAINTFPVFVTHCLALSKCKRKEIIRSIYEAKKNTVGWMVIKDWGSDSIMKCYGGMAAGVSRGAYWSGCRSSHHQHGLGNTLPSIPSPVCFWV